MVDQGRSVDPAAGPPPRTAPDELGTDHLLNDIGERSVRGSVAMFGAQGFKFLAQFGAVVILARLLPPHAFGLIAMTAALYAVLDPLRDFGLSAATIQKPDLTHDEINTLFWVNVGTGTLLATGLFLSAPLVAAFYHEPELVAVTRWVALGFLLSGLSSQHWALLRRQMRFSAVAALETSAELISFVAAIVAALAGAGYWSLVIQRLVGPVLITPGCWILCHWRPSRPAVSPGTGALLRFGGSIAGTALIALFARSIDQVMVGRFWGPSALGLYDRATKLLISPLTNILNPLYSIAIPTLSRIANDESRYRSMFGEILEKLAMVTMPVAAIVVVTADWTTDVLFGSQWHAAAPLVAWFALIIAYQPSIDTCPILYVTQMRPNELLRASIIDAALRIAAIAASLHYGAVAVAAALAISGLFLRAPVAFWLAARRGPVGLSQIYQTLLPSILAAGAVAATIQSIRGILRPAHLAAGPGLAMAVVAGMVVTAAVFWALPRSRHALIELVDTARQLLGRRPADTGHHPPVAAA